MKIFKHLAFSALLAISVSGANAQDYDKGMAAYNAGDFQAALKEWMPLAESGDANAQDNIGIMYAEGKGVIQNYVDAVNWYRLSAYQGNSIAQNNLGGMYDEGNGVIQSNVMAHMWYNIASANGMIFASKWRDEIAVKMTQEEINKAQAMAKECISSGYKDCGW